MNQQRDVSLSLPEWRYVNRKHVETIEEIFAELTVAHHAGKIAVCCRYEPGIHFYGVIATEPFELALLQDSQQLWLQFESDISDFIEKKAALVSKFDPATLLRQCAGERSLLMPE